MVVHSNLLDAIQKPYYLLFMVQRWLGIVLDLMLTGIVVLIIGLTIGLRDSVSAGSLGVSLVNIISFGQYLRMIVVLWTLTETSMGAIARIKGFTEFTRSEDLPEENCTPPATWPQAGRIEFSNVTASYR